MPDHTKTPEETPQSASPGPRFSLRWLFVVITVVSLLLALIWPAVRAARKAAYRQQKINNLKQIGLGFWTYQDTFRHFPGAIATRTAGEPIISWRLEIVPFLESTNLFTRYQFAQPWNSPANMAVCDFRFHAYCDPRAPHSSRFTHIVMPTGTGTVGEKPVTLDDITDRHDQTILVMTLQRSDILWHEPRDLSIREITRAPGNPDRILIRGRPFEGGYCAFVDGSVAQLPAELKYDTLMAMLTIAGGEAVDMAWRDLPLGRS